LKSAIFGTSKAHDLDLDLGSGHTAHRRASVMDHQISLKSKKNFLWTDGRTDVQPDVRRPDVPTDGHFRPTLMLLGRL